MQKLCLLVLLAVLSHEALGFRLKRQAETGNGDNLEDRYGWNRPGSQFQGQFPGWQRYPAQRYPNPVYDYDYMIPDWQNPGFPIRPNRPQNPGQGTSPATNADQQTTATPNSSTPAATDTAVYDACILTCLVTPEYNPVCGSDNRTYDNPGRLLCAQSCGRTVSQMRASRCPANAVPTS